MEQPTSGRNTENIVHELLALFRLRCQLRRAGEGQSNSEKSERAYLHSAKCIALLSFLYLNCNAFLF